MNICNGMTLRSRAVRWALHQPTILSVINFALYQVPWDSRTLQYVPVLCWISPQVTSGMTRRSVRRALRKLTIFTKSLETTEHLWEANSTDSTLQYMRYSVGYAEKLDLYISSHVAGDALLHLSDQQFYQLLRCVLHILLYAVRV